MTEAEAHKILNDVLDSTAHIGDWEVRYAVMSTLEPCIAETYKAFINGGMNPSQFYERAKNDIMAAYSPLGRML